MSTAIFLWFTFAGLPIAQILLAIAKITGVIGYSWWAVLFPAYIFAASIALILWVSVKMWGQ